MGDQAEISGQYSLQELPATSQTLLAVLDLCQDSQSRDEELARLILLDPVLSASLLSMSAEQLDPGNTAMPLMEQAIARLGRSAVQAVALDLARRFCQHPGASMCQALNDRLWHRIILAAKLASAFAILSGYSNPAEAYLVGLLQGIGPLRIVVAAAAESGRLRPTSDEQAILSLGRQLYPEGHSAWAYQLIRQWGMPGFLADALRYQDHNFEEVADAHPLIRISNLAARLANADPSEVSEGLDVAQRWFGVERDLAEEIVTQARAENRQLAAELSIPANGEYSPQPLLTLGKLVDDLLQVQTIVAAVSADESAGVEPRRVFARVLVQAIGCKQFRILLHSASTHQLVGFTDGRDALLAQAEDADWHISLRPARSGMAMAYDQAKARLLSSANENHSLADEQMLGMLGQAAALCLPVIVDPQYGLLVVVGGSHRALLELSNRPRYLQLLCEILARLLRRQRANPGETMPPVKQDPLQVPSNTVREMMHELSNPLNVASNYLSILEHKLLQDGAHYEELAIVREELQRAAELLKGWRIPARSGSVPVKTDVNMAITRLVRVYRATVLEPRNISLVLELDEQEALAHIDAVALQQILRNLIGNAIEAVDDGGHILVKTSAEVYMDSGNYVELLLVDDGPGMPSKVRENIFKPVQSTKGGDHDGLGLSIVKSLIDKANGSIAFRSSAQGTRFQVYLPK